MARRTKQQIERSNRIERLANTAAVGWQINVMDIGKVFKRIEEAVDQQQSDEGVLSDARALLSVIAKRAA